MSSWNIVNKNEMYESTDENKQILVFGTIESDGMTVGFIERSVCV